MTSFLTSIGGFVRFSAQVARRVISRSYRPRELLEQTRRTGVDSLTVVNLCAFAIGLVMVLQSAALLARFGAKAQVATLMSAAFVREIGPVFTAVMFSGRVGTGIAAELASMVVTEQIDAYRTFGTDPVGKLVVPRVLAAALVLPALTMIANVVGVFSGYLMGLLELDVPGSIYLRNSIEALEPLDVICSLVKGWAFGSLVALIACYKGLGARQAAEAVGESTTETMVLCVLSILLADVVLTKLFLTLGA